ncbi:MAG: OsmC family protein [Acidimicrobiia bacterium]
MAVTARVHEFDVTVDRDRNARSGLGGSPLPREAEWWAEHYVLAGLVRCTLASMDYAARRAGANIVGSGSAHGVVTKRDEDGRYAFVEIEASFDVQLAPAPSPEELPSLVEKAEAGCFVGNSLSVRPAYHWTINGEEIS